MKTPHAPLESPRLLEDALYCSIRLIAAMDESVGNGNAIVIPEVIIWAISQLNPALFLQLRDVVYVGELARLLSHYCSLRAAAEEVRYETYMKGFETPEGWGDDHGYLTPANTLRALTLGRWDCPELDAKIIISRVLHTVVERNERNDWSENRFPIDNSWAPSQDPRGFKSKSCEVLASESDTILSSALNHGFKQLLACDDGYDPDFWSKVYSFAVSDWLEIDLPEIANEICARNLTTNYFSGISAFLRRMRAVEAIYQRIGYPICFYLLRTRNEEPLSLLEYYVRAEGTAEQEVADSARLLWEMLKGRNYSIYKRRLYFSDSSCTLIDFVRSSPDGQSTCYVVNSTSLPQCYRSVSDEHYALVVHLPEHRLAHLEELTHWDRLDRFFREDKSNGQCELSLSISHVFCCNFDDLWPMMSLFRRSVPVLYVLERRSLFVLHNFHHFTDSRHVVDTPLRYTPTTVISTDSRDARDVAAHVMVERGRHLAPISVLSSVTKLTKSPGKLLKKALLKEHPEAAVSFRQRVINQYSGLESDSSADLPFDHRTVDIKLSTAHPGKMHTARQWTAHPDALR